jgi:predicted DNA-binding transcriptional regulator YafY
VRRGRGALVVRQWRLLVLLRRGPHTIPQLARELGVAERTVFRDLNALESVPFPLLRDGLQSVTLAAMPEWPRRETTPVQEIRA